MSEAAQVTGELITVSDASADPFWVSPATPLSSEAGISHPLYGPLPSPPGARFGLWGYVVFRTCRTGKGLAEDGFLSTAPQLLSVCRSGFDVLLQLQIQHKSPSGKLEMASLFPDTCLSGIPHLSLNGFFASQDISLLPRVWLSLGTIPVTHRCSESQAQVLWWALVCLNCLIHTGWRAKLIVGVMAVSSSHWWTLDCNFLAGESGSDALTETLSMDFKKCQKQTNK